MADPSFVKRRAGRTGQVLSSLHRARVQRRDAVDAAAAENDGHRRIDFIEATLVALGQLRSLRRWDRSRVRVDPGMLALCALRDKKFVFQMAEFPSRACARRNARDVSEAGLLG